MYNLKIVIIFIFCHFLTISLNADPLTSRTASNCLSQLDTFLNDDSNYYKIHMEIRGVAGHFNQSNSIDITRTQNEMVVILYYNNEVGMRILITKSNVAINDFGIAFDYSQRLGFLTIYEDSFEPGYQFLIKSIFRNIFVSFGVY
jgi:hypothetical protein